MHKVKDILHLLLQWPQTIFNAVEINGKWCLIDTAWDANTISEYYLCTPPKCLVRNHFPQNDDSL